MLSSSRVEPQTGIKPGAAPAGRVPLQNRTVSRSTRALPGESAHACLEQAGELISQSQLDAGFERLRMAREILGRSDENDDAQRWSRHEYLLLCTSFARATGDLCGQGAAAVKVSRSFLADPFAWSLPQRRRLAHEVLRALSSAGAEPLSIQLSRFGWSMLQEASEPRAALDMAMTMAELACLARLRLPDDMLRKPQRLRAVSDTEFRLRSEVACALSPAVLGQMRLLIGAHGNGIEQRWVDVMEAVSDWQPQDHDHPLAGRLVALASATQQAHAAGNATAVRMMLALVHGAQCQWRTVGMLLEGLRNSAPSGSLGAFAADADWLEARQRLATGNAEDAMVSYAAYAATVMTANGLRERLLQAAAPAAVLLALALPAKPAEANSRMIDKSIEICRKTIRSRLSGQYPPGMAHIAAAQSITVRRVEQAFRQAGLPSPARFFSALDRGIAGRPS